MTADQKSIAGYKSKIHESEDFENPNEGKPVLTDQDEYIFRLTKMPHVKTMPQPKKDKNGKESVIQVDKAICEFEEEGTKNIVLAFWRVDSLNFSDDDFESAILRFFRRIGTPVYPDEEVDWEKYFIPGMRFRARVAIGKGQDKKPNGKYFLDVPTCRKILASDMHPEAAATLPSSTPAGDNVALLANALLLCKGAKDFNTAMELLKKANANKEVTMALFQANLDNKVTFPI
jgi:hypothetical protein